MLFTVKTYFLSPWQADSQASDTNTNNNSEQSQLRQVNNTPNKTTRAKIVLLVVALANLLVKLILPFVNLVYISETCVCVAKWIGTPY
jgi:hypothetical protein